MKLQTSAVRRFLLFAACSVTFAVFHGSATAQEKTGTRKDEATRAKFPAAKGQAPVPISAEGNADADSQKTKEGMADKDGPDAIRRREEWFHKQRASANGHIPSGAHRQALEHMQRMMEKEGKLVRRANGTIQEVSPQGLAITTAWSPIGPAPTSGGFYSPVTGRITTIAIDPTDATGNTVLIGGAQGGIWRSTDAGSATPTWTPVGDQNASLSMGSIAFAPSQPATVYAGTGEQASLGLDIYYGAGVLKSTNGGLTWTQTCTTPSTSCPFIGPFSDSSPFEFFTFGGARISYVSVNPSNPQLLLVSAQFAVSGPLEGVYCSADGGATWSNVLSGEMSTFVGFASPTVAFAALGDPFGSGTNKNGIYKSTIANSCAMTFSLLSGGTLPAASSIGRIDMGISPNFATDNTAYASIADGTNGSSTNLGIWVTTNGGTTWTKTAAPDVCQQQCWYDNVVKVDPNGGAHAFFGGAAATVGGVASWVVRTADTGATWTTVIPNLVNGGPGLPHVDNHAMAFIKLANTKVRMYLGNDGGIWRTDDVEAATVAWTDLNDSILSLTQFYPALSVHPSSPNIAFAGAQDNGSQIYAGTNNWTDNSVCGDGTGTAIDNVIPSTVYVACNGNILFVSPQNGAGGTFLFGANGINLAEQADFVPPLVTDPSAANTAYTGTTKVYQTVNGAVSWVALSGDLVNGASLTAMAVAPKNSAVVYAGADAGQVFVAKNVAAGTATFAAVTGQGSLPPRRVSAIAADPADTTGMTAYVAFSGFSFVQGTVNDPKGHLFKTKDGGATWTDVSCTVANCSAPAATDLPNAPVNDVVIDPNVPGTLYVGTDTGVFQSTCTATCIWATLSTGLPRAAVLSLKLHEASRTLIAATHGRGAWDLLLSNFVFTNPHISSLSPVSANAGGSSFALTVNGVGLTSGSVQWNGSATNVTTQQVSDSQLTATIAMSLIAGGGAPQITVKTAAGTSNGLTFTILGGGAPTITSVSPTSALVNAAATPITVVGTGFSPSSRVLMNPDLGGTAIQTTFTDTMHLSATVPASFMAGFGSTNSVGVQNPPPNGGTTVTTATVTLPTFNVIAPAPTNDIFANAMTVTPGGGGTFTDTKDSSAATTETNDPTPPCSQTVVGTVTGRSNTIWYKFTPASNGTITDVDTIGSSYDSVLSIWTGASQAALTNVGCNDDIVSRVDIQSQIQNVSVTVGTTYYIMVSSFGPADANPVALGGKTAFNLQFTSSSTTAPSITSLTPNSGPVGTSVTITGTNFGTTQGTSTVTFNGTTATPTTSNWSAASIVVPVPAGATTGNVIVTVGGVPSNGIAFTVTSGGSFTVSGAATTVTAGGSSANSTISVHSTGFAGTVAITCGTTLPGVTCAALNVPVTSGATATGQLAITVAAPAAQNAMASVTPAERRLYAAGMIPASGGRGWWTLSGITGFAAIILLLLPGRKRLHAALGLGLICVLSFTLGCGGYSGSGGGGGPVATTTHITVTSATKAAPGGTFTFTATVTGGTPTDQVQLLDGGSLTGIPVTVSGGTATLTTAALSTVGMHSITAHYVGDATYTQPSSSGALNVMVTGTTQLPITGTSGSTTASGNVSLTIN